MMDEIRDKYNNASGCADPTAYEAIKKADQDDERFHKLLKTIFSLCNLAGFWVEGRITLVDQKTGRVWR